MLLTVCENERKSLIQHYERSELRLILSGQKLIKNAKICMAKTQMRHFEQFSNNVLLSLL